MEPDKFQQAWQAQSSQTRVTVDAELLLKEVQRNQRDFRATILRRDIIEIGVGLLLLPYWFYKGATSSQPWTWYLTVPAILWVIGFFVVDRRRHPQKPSEPDEPLLACVKNSLTQVEHQIWLLRNVFWWYLLPFTLAILTFFADVAWSLSEDWLEALGFATPFFAFLLGLYSFLDYLNQRAVRADLEPRRRELLGLLASLSGDGSAEEHTTTSPAKSEKGSGVLRRWLLVTVLSFGTFMVLTPAGVNVDTGNDGPPRSSGFVPFARRSPFGAVRWQQLQPEVKVGDEWFKLVSLNEVSAEEIVAFSRRTYGDKWQKRFEEDLVELLTRMGHPPQETVTLVVQSLTSSQTQVLEDVPMTEENRDAIREAAQGRTVQATPDMLLPYEGVYAHSPEFALTITVEEGKLMMQATGQPKLPLTCESETEFVCKAVGAHLYFVADPRGRPKYVVLHQNGTTRMGTRQD